MKPNSIAESDILGGVKSLLANCAEISTNDRVFIISNPSTSHLGERLKISALDICPTVEHAILPEFTIHGQEPEKEIADKMFNATVVFCITKMSMAHTKARLNANNNKVKYFSLPDYSDEVIASKALLADFKKIKNVSVKIADILTNADTVRLTTAKGTDLIMNLKGRKANPAPGFCYDNILLASPPDAETNIAPNELLTNGVVVIDGSIPCREIGLLNSDITLTIVDGMVKDISGEKSEILERLFNAKNDPKFRIIAEFGIGLNKLAVLKGFMLEDEGTLGTVHLGIGSNKTIGGLNEVPFHLDHIICNATILVDNKPIMENGVLIKELLDLL